MTGPFSSAPNPGVRRFWLVAVAVALVFNLWALTRYWNENLMDAFESRQYQTALTAYRFQQDGLRLAYETPVLGPPWSIPMEFPLYQAIVAKLSTVTGMPLEQSGRLTSILAFFGCFPAVWLLLKPRLPQTDDWLAVVAVALLSPMFLFYSRTVLIESTAVCVALWFLAAFDAALRHPTPWRFAAAWVTGALAAATKITTFAVVILPAVLLVIAHTRERRRAGVAWSRAFGRPFILAAVAASLPVVAGVAWVVYSDHLKALNPYGKVLTSSSLREFNFGPLALRFTGKFWQAVAASSFEHVITLPLLIFALAGFFFAAPPYRRLAALCIACYAVGFLTFANLHYVHDYYFYASSFFLVAAVGVVAAGVLQRMQRGRPFAMLAVGAVLLSGPLAFSRSYGGFYRRPNPPSPVIAAVIQQATAPADVFAALDMDWNSTIPYYAQRSAIMVFQSHTENMEAFEQSLANLQPDSPAALLIAAPHRSSMTFVPPLLTKLKMEMTPIASTPDVDLYVRRDLLLSAAARLDGKAFPGVTLKLPAPPSGLRDLTAGDWPAQLTMVHPAPHASRGEFAIGVVQLDGAPAISMQAPTELLVRPPPGAKHLRAKAGMVPGAYQNGNRTDGVVIEIREVRPDGTIRLLMQRVLTPVENPRDRGDIVVDLTQDTPFEGTVTFGAYPGPSGNAAFDWVYWRSIEVR